MKGLFVFGILFFVAIASCVAHFLPGPFTPSIIPRPAPIIPEPHIIPGPPVFHDSHVDFEKEHHVDHKHRVDHNLRVDHKHHVTDHERHVVHTEKGRVQGLIKVAVSKSIEYLSFMGIPYAKPPVNKLRFREPVEAEPWSHVLDCTKEKSVCLQHAGNGTVVGEEDCLYIDVHTPHTDLKNIKEKKPVLVWIYGPGLMTGYNLHDQLAHEHFIEEDVVLVKIQHRLDILGYLALDVKGVKGNAGLKDQNLALRWIKKNIEKFGGDASRITLFGEGSSSAYVGYHMLLPHSKGLFHKSIHHSGTPLCPWAFKNRHEIIESALKLGRLIGAPRHSHEALLEHLEKISASELVRKLHTASMLPSPISLEFGVTIEEWLTAAPIELLKSGKINNGPVMLGFNKAEAILLAAGIDHLKSAVSSALESTAKVIPVNEIAVQRAADIMTKSFVQADVVEFSTAYFFSAAVDLMQRYLVKAVKDMPVLFYRLSLETKENLHELYDNAVNAEEESSQHFSILFGHRVSHSNKATSILNQWRKKMATIWISFAKDIKSSISSTVTGGVQWHHSGSAGDQLDIGQKFSMSSRLLNEIYINMEKVYEFILSFSTTNDGHLSDRFGDYDETGRHGHGYEKKEHNHGDRHDNDKRSSHSGKHNHDKSNSHRDERGDNKNSSSSDGGRRNDKSGSHDDKHSNNNSSNYGDGRDNNESTSYDGRHNNNKSSGHGSKHDENNSSSSYGGERSDNKSSSHNGSRHNDNKSDNQRDNRGGIHGDKHDDNDSGNNGVRRNGNQSGSHSGKYSNNKSNSHEDNESGNHSGRNNDNRSGSQRGNQDVSQYDSHSSKQNENQSSEQSNRQRSSNANDNTNGTVMWTTYIVNSTNSTQREDGSSSGNQSSSQSSRATSNTNSNKANGDGSNANGNTSGKVFWTTRIINGTNSTQNEGGSSSGSQSGSQSNRATSNANGNEGNGDGSNVNGNTNGKVFWTTRIVNGTNSTQSEGGSSDGSQSGSQSNRATSNANGNVGNGKGSNANDNTSGKVFWTTRIINGTNSTQTEGGRSGTSQSGSQSSRATSNANSKEGNGEGSNANGNTIDKVFWTTRIINGTNSTQSEGGSSDGSQSGKHSNRATSNANGNVGNGEGSNANGNISGKVSWTTRIVNGTNSIQSEDDSGSRSNRATDGSQGSIQRGSTNLNDNSTTGWTNRIVNGTNTSWSTSDSKESNQNNTTIIRNLNGFNSTSKTDGIKSRS